MSDPVMTHVLRDATSRREFLAVSGSLAASLALRGLPGWRGDFRPRLSEDPFTLGIASGDPRPDGVVLWTRLAPPAADAGLLRDQRLAVDWEVARDPAFRSIVQKGSVVATPELAHAVHADVNGLEPGHVYWYRFIAGGIASPTGRTRTAPHPESEETLRFAFCSCQHYEQGLYTAYRHMVDEDLHIVLHLGDFIYENGPAQNRPRIHDTAEIQSLDDYRGRYALYRADPDLQAAQAAFPFIVTWDDHEVDNNYAGVHHEGGMSAADFLRRRAAAYQAYWEHMPLRAEMRPRGSALQLYRRLRFGRLAEFSVLDTRQYRSDQPCGDGMRADCTEAAQPDRTMLGTDQRDWLFGGLLANRARWNVLAHQVPIAPVGRIREDGLQQSMDKWAGYLAERDALLAFLAVHDVRNPISIVGDVHVNWLSDLRTSYYDDNGTVVGAEFVGTSISSGGDGTDTNEGTPAMLETNPHVKFFNGQRGYMRCQVTADHWTADYRVVEFVTRPGAPVSTRATFVVEDGAGGAEPA